MDSEIKNTKKCQECDGFGWVMGYKNIDNKMVQTQEQCRMCFGCGLVNDYENDKHNKKFDKL
jgi:DnaJ-class molecular chaperone